MELTNIDYPVLIDHLYAFLEYFVFEYGMNDIGMAYSSYYDILSKSNNGIQNHIWNVLWTISLHNSEGAELQCIVQAIESDKECCKLLIQVRQVFADFNSIKLNSFTPLS